MGGRKTLVELVQKSQGGEAGVLQIQWEPCRSAASVSVLEAMSSGPSSALGNQTFVCPIDLLEFFHFCYELWLWQCVLLVTLLVRVHGEVRRPRTFNVCTLVICFQCQRQKFDDTITS